MPVELIVKIMVAQHNAMMFIRRYLTCIGFSQIAISRQMFAISLVHNPVNKANGLQNRFTTSMVHDIFSQCDWFTMHVHTLIGYRMTIGGPLHDLI